MDPTWLTKHWLTDFEVCQLNPNHIKPQITERDNNMKHYRRINTHFNYNSTLRTKR
jgi:hypothetical protein